MRNLKKTWLDKGFALLIQIFSSTFAANLPAGRQVNPQKFNGTF